MRTCRTRVGRNRVVVNAMDYYDQLRVLPGPWRCDDCEPGTEHADFDAITEHAVAVHHRLLNSADNFNWSYAGPRE